MLEAERVYSVRLDSDYEGFALTKGFAEDRSQGSPGASCHVDRPNAIQAKAGCWREDRCPIRVRDGPSRTDR